VTGAPGPNRVPGPESLPIGGPGPKGPGPWWGPGPRMGRASRARIRWAIIPPPTAHGKRMGGAENAPRRVPRRAAAPNSCLQSFRDAEEARFMIRHDEGGARRTTLTDNEFANRAPMAPHQAIENRLLKFCCS